MSEIDNIIQNYQETIAILRAEVEAARSWAKQEHAMGQEKEREKIKAMAERDVMIITMKAIGDHAAKVLVFDSATAHYAALSSITELCRRTTEPAPPHPTATGDGGKTDG